MNTKVIKRGTRVDMISCFNLDKRYVKDLSAMCSLLCLWTGDMMKLQHVEQGLCD